MANFNWPASSASVSISAIGTNGAAAPTSSIEVGVVDGSGNLQPITQGQAAMAASVPVVIASNQSAIPASQSGTWNITNVSGAVSLPTGAATSALQTTGNTSLSSIDGKLAALGQKAMAGSEPVVIASDQSAIPASQSGTWNVTNVSGTVSLPTGAATSALQTSGNSSLTSIATNTANIPAKGAANTANSTPVNIASDQTVPIKILTNAAGTITQAAITVGTTAVRLTVSGSAPASTRQQLLAIVDSASTAKFYIGSSTVTSSGATRGLQILAGMPFSASNDAGDYWIISDTAGQTVYAVEQS